MDRRTAIKQSALLALAAVVNTKVIYAMSETKQEIRGYSRFKLGKLEITLVTDGHIPMTPVQPNFAPGIDPKKVNQALEAHFASKKMVDLGINIMIIKSGNRMIMIDSGCGTSFGANSGWLVPNLEKAGIKASDITDVVISHAHPDHIGGLTNEAGKLVFPNAEIYLSQIEHDFWMADQQDFSKSKIKDEELKRMVVSVAKKNITAAKSRLYLVGDGDELFGCIRVHLAPGHTPGHCILEVYAGSDRLFHLADLVHSAALVIEHPEWGFEGDTDFELAITSRKKVLSDLAAAKPLVFSYHLLWPGLGHLKPKGQAYEWLPQQSALPDWPQ